MVSNPAPQTAESTLPEFIWDDALIKRYDLSAQQGDYQEARQCDALC